MAAAGPDEKLLPIAILMWALGRRGDGRRGLPSACVGPYALRARPDRSLLPPAATS